MSGDLPHLVPDRLAAPMLDVVEEAHLEQCTACRMRRRQVRAFLASDPGVGLESSRIVGSWEIVEELGRGGMGIVYRIRHRTLGSVAALKVLHPEYARLADRLVLEGKVQSGLRHPNVVAVHDLFSVDGCPALVLEYVEGTDLGRRLAEAPPLDEHQIDAIARGVLRGMAAAHQAGFLHRDLKPANILLAGTREAPLAKVADFGLAKAIDPDEPALTRGGVLLGSPPYMAPEQYRCAQVDRRTDVWGLGCVLYELVTGSRAFLGADGGEVARNVLGGLHRPITELAPHALPRWVTAIEQALAVEPDRRTSSAEELLALWDGGSPAPVVARPAAVAEPVPRVAVGPSGRTYELLQLLGEGGFGEVHLARMTSPGGLDQHVAVKLLHKGLHPDSQAVERLRDEARLLMSLRHPVVLAALDWVEIEGRAALVTEFIEGQDLSACIEGSPPMPPSTLLEVVEQVASALEMAWKQLRVVHRDVKPANIRIGVHGNVKLLDFGIARSDLADRSAKTVSQMLIGTLRYSAPERFGPERGPQPAWDVFSLGCVLYEGLTGQPFFLDISARQMVRLGVVTTEWEAFLDGRLSQLDPSLAPIQELLVGMLCCDVSGRLQAGDVARRCEQMIGRWPDHVPLRRWCRERDWPARPTVTEGRPAPSPSPPPAAVPDPRSESPSADSTFIVDGTAKAPASSIRQRWRLARWVAAALSLGALGSALLLLIAGVGLFEVRQQLSGPPPPAEQPVQPPEAGVVPPPTPVPVPPAVPEPDAPVPPKNHRTHLPPAPTPTVEPEAPPPNVPPAAPRYEITLSSVPLGADVRAATTGELIGTTPFSKPLPAGSLAIRLVAPNGAQTDRTLQVGKNGPKRYVWYIAEDRFEAGY